MRAFCVSLCLLAALLLPANAVAANVPPGNSGANQYTETLPGAGGNKPTNNIGGGGNQGGGASQPAQALSAGAQRSLDQQGAAGRATADLANRTAPPGAATGSQGKPGQTPSGSSGGSSGVLDVLKQAKGSADSGGMGIVLPLTLAGSALAALLFLRWRRRGPGDANSAGGTGSAG